MVCLERRKGKILPFDLSDPVSGSYRRFEVISYCYVEELTSIVASATVWFCTVGDVTAFSQEGSGGVLDQASALF